jgi:hypothetical protein
MSHALLLALAVAMAQPLPVGLVVEAVPAGVCGGDGQPAGGGGGTHDSGMQGDLAPGGCVVPPAPMTLVAAPVASSDSAAGHLKTCFN